MLALPHHLVNLPIPLTLSTLQAHLLLSGGRSGDAGKHAAAGSVSCWWRRRGGAGKHSAAATAARASLRVGHRIGWSARLPARS